ncbi:rap gtpase-activating protein [Anaeramoeba flamelloides]|uniref:Rap gtpase-activating protein n=1 Tax=Anaeramoeba flamelloides TaxID=1746091 RepID=A0AAV7Z113_9EUKA|nr:rap gtpase-activating protein [Anaeramoeba flamelloides]
MSSFTSSVATESEPSCTNQNSTTNTSSDSEPLSSKTRSTKSKKKKQKKHLTKIKKKTPKKWKNEKKPRKQNKKKSEKKKKKKTKEKKPKTKSSQKNINQRKNLETKENQNNNLLIRSEDWKIEYGTKDADPNTFEHIKDNKIFQNKFVGNDYKIFCGKHPNKGHIIFCLQPLNSKNKEYLVLAIGKDMYKLTTIKRGDFKSRFFINACKPSNLAKAFKKYDQSLIGLDNIIQMDPEIEEKEIIKIENEINSKQLKVGVLYVKQGQNREEEFFKNQTMSYDFKKFLKILGDKVRLKGFKKYSGGLDTTSDYDGSYGIYNKIDQYEIMFHVSTYLPFDKFDKHQVTRKRHIGNDIVTIVFMDGDAQYDPRSLLSRQNHIIIGIKSHFSEKEPDQTFYQIEVGRKNYVNKFEPYIPESHLFPQNEITKFLLLKIISGQQTAKKSGPYQRIMERFREAKIRHIYECYED